MLTNSAMCIINDRLRVIYEKYQMYLVFTLTYCDFVPENPVKICLNVYMPSIGHNTFSTFGSFLTFLDKIIKEGIKDPRIASLEKDINVTKRNIEISHRLLERDTKALSKLVNGE